MVGDSARKAYARKPWVSCHTRLEKILGGKAAMLTVNDTSVFQSIPEKLGASDCSTKQKEHRGY